jgi:hypothetical protein
MPGQRRGPGGASDSAKAFRFALVVSALAARALGLPFVLNGGIVALASCSLLPWAWCSDSFPPVGPPA